MHIYNATSANLLIETSTNGNASIEFRRGTDIDAYNDFRFFSENGYLKLQINKNLLSFTDTNAQLLWCNDIQTTNFKDFYDYSKMNISSAPVVSTYMLQVDATTNSTEYYSTNSSEGTLAVIYKTLTFDYNTTYPVLAADDTNLIAWYKLDGNMQHRRII